MKLVFFFALFTLTISCNKKQEVHLSCEQQHKKAKNDFNNNKFIYFDYLQSNDFDRKLYSRLLQENNITLDTLIPEGCIPLSTTDLNNEHCYIQMMNNNLNAKFGHRFFDSLRLKATIKNN